MNKFLFSFLVFLIFTSCHHANNNANKTTATDTANHQPDSVITNNEIKKNTAQPTSNSLIIAGESLGKISLGMDASNLENILGKPDMSDAAMGKAWLSWYGKKRDDHNNKTELDIYTAYKDNTMRQKTVQQIRTTSSFFTTQNNIHVYSSLDDIKKEYPSVYKAAQYKSKDGRAVIIYDEKREGIAFEVVSANMQNICTGIIIHTKNKSVNDIYLTLHPNMKRFDEKEL